MTFRLHLAFLQQVDITQHMTPSPCPPGQLCRKLLVIPKGSLKLWDCNASRWGTLCLASCRTQYRDLQRQELTSIHLVLMT